MVTLYDAVLNQLTSFSSFHIDAQALFCCLVMHHYSHICKLLCGSPSTSLRSSEEIRSSATAEIARVGGRYAMQGHSMSLMLIRMQLPISK